MRYYSYDEFIEDLKTINSAIDIKIDTIVAIARGGLTFAHFLAERRNIRSVYSVSAIGYEGQKKLECVEVSHLPDLKCSQNILVVDDIVDSGDTILEVLNRLQSIYTNKNFHTASLFYKKTAKIKPHYYVQETDEWIEFFWSKD